jgi:hypothetical protein
MLALEGWAFSVVIVIVSAVLGSLGIVAVWTTIRRQPRTLRMRFTKWFSFEAEWGPDDRATPPAVSSVDQRFKI